MSISKIVLIAVFALVLGAALPTASFSWETVFEVRHGAGSHLEKQATRTMIDTENTIAIGIEVMGVRFGYDSRYGLGALIEF